MFYTDVVEDLQARKIRVSDKVLTMLISFFSNADIDFYLNPDKVVGICEKVSEGLAKNIPDMQVLYLHGYRKEFPNKHSAYSLRSDPDPQFYHVVNLYDGMVVDFTARQLDSTCAVPYISPYEVFIQDWIYHSRDFETIKKIRWPDRIDNHGT